MKSPVKAADAVIFFLALALTAFSVHEAYVKPSADTRVLVRGQNSEWIFQLSAEETVSVSGPLGNTVIRIHENSAWVESSPCENQTCIAAGLIRRQGQWAACLPNNVLLIIEGRDTDIDAISW